VVDPGVGTARRAIALQTSKGYLVGPDNGIFSGVVAQERAVAAVAIAEFSIQNCLGISLGATDANLESAGLNKVFFGGANLTRTDLTGTDFVGTNLADAYFCETVLPKKISIDPNRDCLQ
jgi:hypothetical protein